MDNYDVVIRLRAGSERECRAYVESLLLAKIISIVISPCKICGMEKDYPFHATKEQCGEHCKAPEDHHEYISK